MARLQAWRRWAAQLKRNLYALYLAAQDARTPLLAKLLIGLTLAYALSPIDLIPDFIPVLGYLDDVLLLPAGIWLAMRLIPDAVWHDCQEKAAQETAVLPQNRVAAGVIVLLWCLLGVWLGRWWLGR